MGPSGSRSAILIAPRSLTIDPVLDFVTYLGGKKMEIGHGIALDGSGNIYVAGETLSTGLPTTNFIQFGSTNFQKFRGGNNVSSVTLSWRNTTNSGALQFLTYLGGKTGRWRVWHRLRLYWRRRDFG